MVAIYFLFIYTVFSNKLYILIFESEDYMCVFVFQRFHGARSPAADWGPSDPSVDLQHYNKRCLTPHKTGQAFNLQPVLVMTVHPDGDDPERGSSPNTPEEAVYTLGNQEVNI